jgi:hypothetical protein
VGHTIHFIANKPTHVPPEAVRECVEAGAVVSASMEEHAATGDSVQIDLPLMDEVDRADKIMESVAAIQTRNDPKQFTASGFPKVAAVSAQVGFQVHQSEINSAVERLREADHARLES